jgi:hypothetical protein
MNKPLKYSKEHLTATLISSKSDSFGTRTLIVSVYSAAINETVEWVEEQDEGSWVEPMLVLKNIVEVQLEEEAYHE